MRPLRVVGLDLSLTGTGIAATHTGEGTPRLWCSTVTPRRRPTLTRIDHERLHEAVSVVMGAARCRPDLVAIEEPLVTGTGNVPLRLAELHGAVKHWLWSRSIPYVDVHPSKVKTYATGNGGAKKDVVLASMIATYGTVGEHGVHIGSDDEADALSLLAMTLDQYGQALVDRPESHRRALSGVRWPLIDLADRAVA
ncbi:crossover junction endodeoxyribonuclease RuvC [Actinoplanes rectilineatus]|uniref:crossover junction endodeoxyribonuclease RuvC n=1 Tax=Actinoplanes rectilineatus TaxID=113571 RepID=UPI0005F2F941|nr:crossover junction endodeoxyribonuclease RuvC [Actinoplanes rectilineatus]